MNTLYTNRQLQESKGNFLKYKNMNLKDYQKNANRTCPDLGSQALNLSHMVLGMCSELSELEDAIYNKDSVNIGEEIADIYWYIANYETFRGYTLDEYNMTAGGIGTDLLYYDVSTLQDLVKKFIAYKKVIDTDTELKLLASIKQNLFHLLVSHKLNQSEYLQKNIDKLKQRYPEKFTTEKALNRDLSAERKILEA